MDYGLAKRYPIDVIARLSGADQNRQLEADALEHVLGVAEEVPWAREVAERLRFRLERLTAALQEAERLGCMCDPDAGRRAGTAFALRVEAECLPDRTGGNCKQYIRGIRAGIADANTAPCA